MSYQALARTWRPKNFEDMVGQEHVKRALSNALQQNRLHHAYLFSGTRGVGKTTVARIFAKALNCEEGSSAHPCGKCKSCIEIDSGNHVDLIEVDAASRTKVEQTRELLDNVQYKPVSGRYKIYLIDEVHMFSNNSFNALLKTLEEPPEHVKFLLATTDPKKCPITVLSRCLQFNLHPISTQRIQQHLESLLQKENKDYDSGAIYSLSKAAQGSIRDALSLLDQLIIFSADKVSEKDVEQMLGSASRESVLQLLVESVHGNVPKVLDIIEGMANSSVNFSDCLDELSSLLHQYSVYNLTQTLEEETLSEVFGQLENTLSLEETQLYYQILLDGKRELEIASSIRMGFEMLILRVIAFRPNESGSGSSGNEPIKKSPIERQVNAAPVIKEQKQTIKDHTPQNSQVTQPIETEKTTNISEINGENWHRVVEQLQIAAMAKQLADNCSFHSFNNGILELNLPESLNIFLNSSTMQKLENALLNYSQSIKSLKITQFSLNEEQASEHSQTPAQIRQQEEINLKQNLKESLLNDSTVKELQQNFGARLIEDSVQAIEQDIDEV